MKTSTAVVTWMSDALDEMESLVDSMEAIVEPDVSTRRRKAIGVLQELLVDLRWQSEHGFEDHNAAGHVALTGHLRRAVRNDRDIYLDSGCTAHLMHSRMLKMCANIRELHPPVAFRGIGGSITCDRIADSTYLRDIHFSDDVTKNLVSMARLQDDGFKIFTDEEDGGIRATRGDVTFLFRRHHNLYALHRVVATEASAEDLALAATQDELARAQRAREWHNLTGHRGRNLEQQSLSAGHFRNCSVTLKDLALSDALLGPCQVCILAKAKTPALTASTREHTTVIGHTQHVDVMFYRDSKSQLRSMFFFVDEASHKVVISISEGRNEAEFELAMTNVNAFYAKNRHSKTEVLYSDNEPAIHAYEIKFNLDGGQIFFKAAGQHDGLVEGYIGIFKGVLRTVLLGLDYVLPPSLFKFAVSEAVEMMDIRPTSKTNGVPVGEIVKGIKPDLDRIRVPFGAYGLATTPKERNMPDDQVRAEYGIVVRRPFFGDLNYLVYNLETGKLVSRKGFRVLPMTDEVRANINSKCAATGVTRENYVEFTLRGGSRYEAPEEDNFLTRTPPPLPNATNTGTTVTDAARAPSSDLSTAARAPTALAPEAALPPRSVAPAVEPAVAEKEVIEQEPTGQPFSPPKAASTYGLRPREKKDYAKANATGVYSADGDDVSDSERKAFKDRFLDEAKVREITTNALYRAGIAPDGLELDALYASIGSAYAAKQSKAGNMTFRKAKMKHGAKAAKSSIKEIKQMVDKDIFRPTYWSTLSESLRKKLIRSHTFFKEKYSVDGDLERLKARLVAGGDLVDSSLLGDIAAPTARPESIFLCHGLAAQFRWLVTVMDIPCAYLNTRLPEDERIPMRLGPEEVDVLLQLKPEWTEYRNDDGSMIVLIYGGLYGLPQAAMLWNGVLTDALTDMGYVPTPEDPCVLVKFDPKGRRSIVIIYVDDLLHLYEKRRFQRELLAMLSSKFDPPTVHEGDKGIYIGVEFEYNRDDASVFLSMRKYTAKMLIDFNIQSGADTPTASNFMVVDDTSPEIDQREFASAVMSIFYMAQRTRPDVLFPVTVLASRIHDCREFDRVKLNRLFRYIFATQNYGVILRPRGTTLMFSVDASYAIHANARSHSGLHVTLCDGDFPAAGFGGAFFCRSNAQKQVALSSFEAELNASRQNQAFYGFFRGLMQRLGFDQSAPSLLPQDNMATIGHLLSDKIFNGRSKHIDVRVYYTRELIQAGVIMPLYQPTEDMAADPLTKPFSARSEARILRRLLFIRDEAEPSDVDDPWVQKERIRRSTR